MSGDNTMARPSVDAPTSRRLRILAFDPSLATRLETATVNEISVDIRWEDDLKPGPIGEYVEVIDFDPSSGVFYRPVNLDHRYLLAEDGIAPTESNPQFHQQMVYAVAMSTIRHFERALGRVAFWSDHTTKDGEGKYLDQFVRRLRIYPHALRDRNAYYSPQKKALLFGYFPVTKKDAHNTPGTLVFTCLSHDIIAHEVTHALLDGVHPRFSEATNLDVHAFHEAFADIVALFQHFSYPTVLESQIRRTGGDLATENLLGQLAQQFGRATGRGSALRDALGGIDQETGKWTLREPDPQALTQARGAHERGSILVAAVFRAFINLYTARTADLFRIAGGRISGSDNLTLYPDLVRRLTEEAAKYASRVLQMCIRAIDYCPPVNITFGDFLRGVITADMEYAPEDERGYRIVFIESFREWGIHPQGVMSMGPDALAWPSGDDIMHDLTARGELTGPTEDRKTQFSNAFLNSVQLDWRLQSDRYQVWCALDKVKWRLWEWLHEGGDSYGRDYAKVFGLVIRDEDAPPTVYRGNDGTPSIEVHSVRPSVRRTVSGDSHTDLVVEITQRRRGYFDPEEQKKMDRRRKPISQDEHGDFIYRAGCTVLIDQSQHDVRRVICTSGTVTDDVQLELVRRFVTGSVGAFGNAFDGGLGMSMRKQDSFSSRDEPFALLHTLAEG